MARVLIFQRPCLGSPILQRERPGFVVQFDNTRPQHADPLTGWAGGAETVSQVQILCDSLGEAVAYCQREGHDFEIIPPTPHRLILQSYADNFR